MSDKIKLNGSNWTPKITQRSRGRMKVTFKMSKEESEAFKNWSSVVRPDTVSDEEFYRTIFFGGVEHLNMQLQAIAQRELAKKNLEAQKAEAVTPTVDEKESPFSKRTPRDTPPENTTYDQKPQ